MAQIQKMEAGILAVAIKTSDDQWYPKLNERNNGKIDAVNATYQPALNCFQLQGHPSLLLFSN
jgi:hypothetical protein